MKVSSSPEGFTVWIAPSAAPTKAMSDPSGAHVGLSPDAIIDAFSPDARILQISPPRTKVSLLPPGAQSG
jgi:hypothetical protein